jgi:hypothetical protein
MASDWDVRSKAELAAMHGMKLCRGNGVMAPLFLHRDVAWRKVFSFTPQHLLPM